jgi:hypothetical protein
MKVASSVRKTGLKSVECVYNDCGAQAVSAAGSAYDLDVVTELEGWNIRMCSLCGRRYWARANAGGTFDVDDSPTRPAD